MQGRPTKLTDTFAKATEEVLLAGESNYSAIIHTDEDLVQLINQKLPEHERISDRTFKRWKAKASDDEDTENGILEMTFVPLLKKAKVIQKEQLFERFFNCENGWQRYAWILERKYKEWNIRQSEQTHSDEPLISAIEMKVTCPENCKVCESLNNEKLKGETQPNDNQTSI